MIKDLFINLKSSFILNLNYIYVMMNIKRIINPTWDGGHYFHVLPLEIEFLNAIHNYLNVSPLWLMDIHEMIWYHTYSHNPSCLINKYMMKWMLMLLSESGHFLEYNLYLHLIVDEGCVKMKFLIWYIGTWLF